MKTNSTIEKRFTPTAEVRLEGPAGADTPQKIVGYAAVYNALSKPMKTSRGSTFKERILPGAFDTAAAADVLARYNHELILGRTKAGTLKLSLDDKGLRYEITPPNTAAAQHVLESIRRGDIDGSSFAFRTAQEGWRMESGEAVRELKTLDLIDVGPVDLPAYGATAEAGAAVSLRSLGTDEAQMDSAVEKLQMSPAGGKLEQRYYYDPDASPLTRALRNAITYGRETFDAAQGVIDTLDSTRNATLGLKDRQAATDCADELQRCIERCTLAIAACRTAAGVTTTTAAAAAEGERSEKTPTAPNQTPLLAERMRRQRVRLI